MRRKTRFLIYTTVFVLLLMMVIATSTAVFAVPVIREVPCTVTSNTLSVLISGGPVEYGVLSTGGSADTTNGDTLTVTNDGDEIATFQIMSSDAIYSSGTDWTLSSSTGDDEFVHSFSTSGEDPYSWSPLTNSYQTLATSVDISGSINFDLKIDMPTSVTDYEEHIITVTVRAVTP